MGRQVIGKKHTFPCNTSPSLSVLQDEFGKDQLDKSFDRATFVSSRHIAASAHINYTLLSVCDTPASRLPARFRLTNGNRQLKILDVCKTCGSNGLSDLQVIQCNASNEHGYAFRNAYVNVLRQLLFFID